MSAVYSERPLKDKLGLSEGMSVWLFDAPDSFLGEVGIKGQTNIESEGLVDYGHWFVTSKQELRALGKHVGRIKLEGMLWVSWPKKASKISTDLTEQELRNTLLPTGLVDVKVCAIDEVWSGLKFVWRKDLRRKG